jgi:Nse4 C-terminal
MSKKNSLEQFKIPNNYGELCEHICENEKKIIENPEYFKQILKSLNSLLTDANTMSDLHRDTSIILQAIKIQQDALLKEYKNDLTHSKILSMANDGHLEDFYRTVARKRTTLSFVDHLDLEYNTRVAKPRGPRLKYDTTNGETSVPEKLEDPNENENESVKAIQKIKSVVEETGKIEYFDLIMDIDSYSKTILNAFNLALAIRSKAVSFIFNNQHLYVVPYSLGTDEGKHSVFNLTPLEYKNILEKRNISKSMLE